ncbi:MAG: tyrosine-type recombinase/integrase [Clostridiales Family XIII bacterium]|jgi:integrase/recombinase XerD|nr:tyrosine-type recombinase/integrase [Clostridiales Family XIII bacterium]
MKETIPYNERFKEFLYQAKKLAAASVAAYVRDVDEFAAFLAERGVPAPSDAVRADIAAYILLLRREGRSAATVSRKMASIRAFYRYMSFEGYCRENPALEMKLPRIVRKDIEYLSLEEADTLLKRPDDSIRGIRDRAILELLYATGLRVSEAVEADTEHINLRMGFITCTGEHGKARIIPIGRPARAALETYIFDGRSKLLRGKPAKDKALFLNYSGDRMTRQGMWRMIREYAAAAGIERKITPQILRNSFAVHMVQNGADLKSLQELMGHEDPTAMQVYLRVSKNRIKDVYDTAHPRA